LLCHRLNEAGETAALWPSARPRVRLRSPLTILRWFKHALTRRERGFSRGPFPNRLARPRDIEAAIVVYPEIVDGNPLAGKRVVRWFLHKPGYLTGSVNYGKDDLFFYFIESFNDPSINPHSANRLALRWIHDAYFDRGTMRREASCYLLRKGAGRPLVHDLTGSIQIDSLSHQEKAEQFNTKRRFYSYDLYTMYSVYAALCGCISIVVPEPGLSRDDWLRDELLCNGVAYGEEDIPRALATRDALISQLTGGRADEDRMLADFIAKCKAWAPSR
jgi:hypothetical protein